MNKRENSMMGIRIYSPENKKYSEAIYPSIELAKQEAITINELTLVPLEVHEDKKIVAKVGRLQKRANKNPVRKHRSDRQQRAVEAIQLYQRFRVDDPKFVDEIEIEFHDVLMEIGKLKAVEYDTIRAGKKEFYRHEFAGKSAPILAASWDGAQLYILNGSYNFQTEGIVDVDPLTGKKRLK